MKIVRNKNIFSIILFVSIIFNTSFNTNYAQGKVKTILIINNTDYTKLMSAMFPQKLFTKHGRIYQAGKKDSYYIESIIPGSFIN